MALAEIRTVTRVRHPEKIVVTSSRGVACTFETHHENITDIIENMFEKTRYDVPLLSKLSCMFEAVNIVDENGNDKVDYYMNKDGFILVMMKLTGNGILEKTNLFWVVEYLAAFNQLQENLTKEQYKYEYLENSPERRLLIMDILQNASLQGPKKLEAALTYYADYIPDRLREIYRPDSRKNRKCV